MGFCSVEFRHYFLSGKNLHLFAGHNSALTVSVEILSVYPDANIYSQQAADKTCQVAGHHSETGSKPPTQPAKDCYTDQQVYFFHSIGSADKRSA
jgi:hypothetical protein